MNFLSQTDPLWKNKKINGTSSTINSYGCLVTDITWLLNQAGYTVTPDELAKKGELFDGAYWKGWTALEEHFPKMKYVWGERCTDYPAPIDKIVKEVNDGYFPIIMLDYAPKVTGLQTHYLVVLGHDDKNNLKVGDPIDGSIVWLDSRYGEVDEKYKILKIDVYHFEKVNNTEPNMWERIKGLLTQENNFSESDIRAMVDVYKQRDATERTIKELNENIKAKAETISQKDKIISDIKTELSGINETIKHYKDFQNKLSIILGCSPEEGDILAQVVIAVGNESKLLSCQADKQNIINNQDRRIGEEVDKLTFELKLKVATLTIDVEKKDKLIADYQKKIDILTLGRTIPGKPIVLIIKNSFNKLYGSLKKKFKRTA